jgi:RND family efflux transporter MFP subunit
MTRKAVIMELKCMSLSNYRLNIFAILVASGSLSLGCKPTVSSLGTEGLAKVPTSVVERVSAGPVPKKTLQLFSTQPARVEPYEQAPILSKITGYVESVAVDVGDRVHKGDLLISLSAPEYQDAVVTKLGLIDQVTSQVKQAEAGLVASQAAVDSAKALVLQAQAGIDKAEALVQRWKSENARISKLSEQGTVTKQLADETLSQYQAAVASKKEIEAMVGSEEARLLEAQAQVGKAQADLEAAHAKLAVAKGEHAHAVSMANYLRILAPFDGVITQRNIDAGHYVQPAGSAVDRPLLTITNSDRVRIHVDIPEAEAHYVDAGSGGDCVEIFVPSNPRLRFSGEITRASTSLDTQSRCLPIQIELQNVDHKLLSGAFVQAKVLLDEKKDALSLPISGIVRKGDESLCCVVVGGKIEFRSIQLGLRVGDDVEVLSGLDGSETVVLARAGGLKSGQNVEVMVKK